MPRGYRSATEYRFREDQTGAIIRATAYHRKDFCLSVIWFSPREHQTVRDSIANPFERASNLGRGTLDRLPLELLHNVLLRLDMQSLFNFRQTNIRSRQMVHFLKQYQLVVSHGINLFCALLRTRLALSVSLFDIYHALCTKDCGFWRIRRLHLLVNMEPMLFQMSSTGSRNPSSISCRCAEAISLDQGRNTSTDIIQNSTWKILDGRILAQIPHCDRFYSSSHVVYRTATARTSASTGS